MNSDTDSKARETAGQAPQTASSDGLVSMLAWQGRSRRLCVLSGV